MNKLVPAVFALALTVLVACGDSGTSHTPSSSSNASGETTPQRGGTLVYGIQSFPGPIDPLKISAASDLNVGHAIFDTLLQLDKAGNPQPQLASSYKTTDGGSTWVLSLRSGVTFQDGTDFDAAAVVAHFKRLMNPANACACASDIAVVKDVVASGPLEVTITSKQPSAWFPTLLTGPVGMVAAAASTADKPIGTGPFMWESAAAGDRITLERNPSYWQKGLPYLDKIVYLATPDPTTQLSALQAGDIQIYWESNYQNWPKVEADSDLQLINYGGFGSYIVYFNVDQPPFNDPRARLAVTEALDAKTFNDTINAGQLQPATSVFPRTSWAYPGELSDYPKFDLDAAKAQVADLGGLSFSITVPQLLEPQAVALQAMLQSAGMKVTITTGENLAMITAMLKHQYTLAYSAYSAGPDPHTWAVSLTSTSSRNIPGLQDPQLDSLVEQLDSTIDQSQRKDIVKQIADKMAQELPLALIANYNQAYAASKKVHGVAGIGDGVVYPATVWLEH